MKILTLNSEQAVCEHIRDSGSLFVHRYNPKHDTLRHIVGRMLKEAKLKLVRRSSTGCEYQANEKS